MSTRRGRKQVVLTLYADEYERLRTEAAAAERDPYQHARWLVLRALAAPERDEQLDEPQTRTA